jgi:hypothetical protein
LNHSRPSALADEVIEWPTQRPCDVEGVARGDQGRRGVSTPSLSPQPTSSRTLACRRPPCLLLRRSSYRRRLRPGVRCRQVTKKQGWKAIPRKASM